MRNTVDTTKPETYRGDKPFKRTARTHQSNFRATYLKVPFDSDNKFGKYGAFLMPLDADKGLNFCDEFRLEILDKIQMRYPHLTATQHDGLYANIVMSMNNPQSWTDDKTQWSIPGTRQLNP